MQLEVDRRNIVLFETLAAINERFAKLQDLLAAAMRHACLLSGEPSDRFLKVLSFFQKVGVIISVENWQLCRAARSFAAHDYEINYAIIAEHFNTLSDLVSELFGVSARLLVYCDEFLRVSPKDNDFASDFIAITTQ